MQWRDVDGEVQPKTGCAVHGILPSRAVGPAPFEVLRQTKEIIVKRFRAITGLAALALIPMLVLAACTAGGGADAKSVDGHAPDMPALTIAMITHAAPGDTFWDIIRKGAESAAAKDNVKLLYSSDPDAGRQAQLVQQAIDQKVDGIAVTLAKPDALKDVLAKATAAGIPFVAFNAGSDSAIGFGAITYFGQEEKIAGEAVGSKLLADGYTHPICMIQEQGHVGLEARCAGVKEKVPGTEILYVVGTDMTQVSSTLTAKLQATKDADVVVGLGAPFTLAAVKAVADVGSKAKVASFDMNADLAQQIADGKVIFTVDQQPYLQGYESIDSLWLYNRGLFKIGGGQSVLTGPTIVTPEDAKPILKFAKEGIR